MKGFLRFCQITRECANLHHVVAQQVLILLHELLGPFEPFSECYAPFHHVIIIIITHR